MKGQLSCRMTLAVKRLLDVQLTILIAPEKSLHRHCQATDVVGQMAKH